MQLAEFRVPSRDCLLAIDPALLDRSKKVASTKFQTKIGAPATSYNYKGSQQGLPSQ